MKLYNKDCMEMFSEIGDASVDLFISDVSYKTTATGIACKQLNRDFIGCEIDKTYFAIAKERINEIKGTY